MSEARSRATPSIPPLPARVRVPCTVENLSAGDHVIYGGPHSDFECVVLSIIGDVATCKAIRSETDFPAPIAKLTFVEREAT